MAAALLSASTLVSARSSKVFFIYEIVCACYPKASRACARVPGWDEGVRTMNKGERATLYISADFAYGKDGRPPVIPPNSPLIFEVELLDFKTAELTKTGTNFL